MFNQTQKKTNTKKKNLGMANINKNNKKTKSSTAISLEKLRKSKEFRELGDMLYID